MMTKCCFFVVVVKDPEIVMRISCTEKNEIGYESIISFKMESYKNWQFVTKKMVTCEIAGDLIFKMML